MCGYLLPRRANESIELDRPGATAVIELAVEPAPHGRRRVAAAREGQERVGAVRGVVMARTILPDAAVLVPLLAVGPQAFQAERAGLLVEVTAGEGAADC